MIKARYGVAAAILGILAAAPFAPLLFSQVPQFIPVTESVLTNPDPADWLMINRTFDQHRFSPLNQINKNNVGQLRMAWTRGLPAGTQEPRPPSTAASSTCMCPAPLSRRSTAPMAT